MIYNPSVYTVESVTSGHPDKVCDQVSDAILDACLAQDRNARVAIECFGSGSMFVVGGEVTTSTSIDYESIVRKVYADIGYEDVLNVATHINEQSSDIALGVDVGGAGDQGIMYGFATNETEEYLPSGVVIAHKLTKGLEDLRRGGIDWLLPDGKAQVTIARGTVSKVLVSTQHKEWVNDRVMRKTLIEKLIQPIVGDMRDSDVLINPTGRFVLGGFEADTGLTGRKIMVDTYGGIIPHGGGAFSGKDASKVDRSAAYMARFVAKNLIARGLAKKCLVSVAYAIGRAKPLMVEAIDENGKRIEQVKEFDFRPAAIIYQLDLRRPIFQQTASYGHFGKKELTWERII